MSNTIFEKIINREIPAEIIYEDDNYIAVLDIFPKSKGHALVITKQPYRWVNDVENFGEYFEIAKKVAQSIQRALGATYISYQTYGTEIPHAHIHIVPRYNLSEERLERYQPAQYELSTTGKLIREEIKNFFQN